MYCMYKTGEPVNKGYIYVPRYLSRYYVHMYVGVGRTGTLWRGLERITQDDRSGINYPGNENLHFKNLEVAYC